MFIPVKMKKILVIFCFICFKVSAQPIANYTLSQSLIKNIKKENINMNYSRSYMGMDMNYMAVPMKPLLTKLGVKEDYIVELIAKDNFSVFVPAYLFLQTSENHSIAYLAIEPKEGWPKLNNGTNDSAGPYQVIWTNPSYSHISDEYWAWSVTRIAIHATYPENELMPPPKTKDAHIKHGHQIYISHCASCHAINGVGKAVIGPDLGASHNPLNYYPKRSELKAFIRNPNKFRKGRMSSSSKAGMSDNELNALIDYFEFIKIQSK
jgi:mono/diheme cytochrome c family protein